MQATLKERRTENNIGGKQWINQYFLGFRIEIIGKMFPSLNLEKKYNSTHKETFIYDVHKNSKILVSKINSIILARGDTRNKNSGLTNFGVMVRIDREEAERIAKIINVLGNDRLIKEKVSFFVSQKSTLNTLKELAPLRDAFIDIEKMVPGFTKYGWYFAPEMIY
jgi:hypothetical protein